MINSKLFRKLQIELRRISAHRTEGAEKEIRKYYKRMLVKLIADIGVYYMKFGLDGRLNIERLQQKQVYARFLEQTLKDLDGINVLVAQLIDATVTKTYEHTYAEIVKATSSATGMKELEKLANVKPDVVKQAVENPISGLTLSDTLEKNRKNIQYEIKRAVTLGLVNNDTADTMAKRITTTLDNDYRKAIRVIRTETHRVKEVGALDAAKASSEKLKSSNIEMVKVWQTMQDERVRPNRGIGKSARKYSKANHVKMQGVQVSTDAYFSLGNGVQAQTPGNSGSAVNDINCRCFLTYEMVEKEFNSESEDGKIELEKQIRNDIKNGVYKLEHNKQRYQNHLLGHKDYEEYIKRNKTKGLQNPSYLTISYEEANKLVEEYAGRGELVIIKGEWKKKEDIFSHPNIIGCHINQTTGFVTETNCFRIHYSGTGTHIVPTLL